MSVTVDEIYNDMKSVFADETGLTMSDGGDMAIRLRAIASQLYTLWVQAQWVKKQCFPQTAEGEHLEYHAQVRGLERGAALKAAGKVRFSIENALATEINIPAGTVCSTAAGVEFITDADAFIEAGNLYCDAAATALETGAVGNVPAGAIETMVQAPVGVSGCTNTEAFCGGTDTESDEELRVRVVNSYRRLPNGANSAYYESIALGVDGVSAVAVIPKSRGIGTLDVVVASESGVPTNALVQQIQGMLDEQREICVDIEVLAPDTIAVNIAAAITTSEGYEFADVKTAVEEAVAGYFTGALLGRDVLMARIGNIIYAVEGVENYVLSLPNSDISIEKNQLPTLGTVSITRIGA